MLGGIMRKKIGLAILIIGLFLLIVGFILAIFLNEDKDKEEVLNNEKLSSTLYNKYHDEIALQTNYFELYFFEDLENFNVSKLSDKDKTKFILDILYNSTKDHKEITSSDIIREGKKYFSNFNLYSKNISSSDGKLLYKYDNGTFSYVTSDNNGFYRYSFYSVSSVGYVDHWIEKKKMYFIKNELTDNNQYVCSVYSLITDYKNNKSIYSFPCDQFTSVVDDYSKIENLLNTYTYTFKKSGKNYYLDSIKMED